MHEHDGTHVNSAAGDGADPESPRSEWGRHLSVGLAMLLMGLLSLVGSASAAPSDTAPIGRFLSAGVEVDLELSQASFFSDHANEPVEVVCVDGATRMKVRGYFGQGESVLTGWTSAIDVQVSGWTPKPCVWGPKLRAQPVTCSFVRGR